MKNGYAINLLVCHGCDSREKLCRGDCHCTLDGRTVKTHARANSCPAKRFGIEPTDETRAIASRITTPAALPPTILEMNRPFAPIPRKQWPEWTKQIADRQADGDRGVGDTVEREIGPFASSLFKAWYKAIFKKTCGCDERKQEWNEEYLYRRLT